MSCSSAEIDAACEVVQATSTPAASSVSTNAADESPADATTSASIDASDSPSVHASSFNNLTDNTRWPSEIDDELRTILVRNRANVVQRIDFKF